jgi:RNA polymerase sigma-54 factor
MARSRVTVQQTQRMALTTGLLTSIGILRADAESLTKQLEDLAAENPQLVLTRPPVQDWLPRWKSAFAKRAMTGQSPQRRRRA